MKLKDILYRNYHTLSEIEKQFYEDNRDKFELNMCDMFRKELLDEEDQHLLISHHDLQKVCTFLCIYIYTDVYIYIF